MKNLKFHDKFIYRSPVGSVCKNISNNIFSESLYISTPVLWEEYRKHNQNQLTDDKALKKLKISLYKYETRASSRCTPFGLFAGVGMGNWSNTSSIILDKYSGKVLKRKTRLDMNVLCSLAQELAKKSFIKPYLKFYLNTSIYLVGNSYRYIEYYYQNNQRFHKINKVDFSEYLKYILTESKSGLTHQQLTALLVDEDIQEPEAANFINELITSQLLINQLEPTVTGSDYFEVLMSILNNINEVNPSEDLNQLINMLKEIDIYIKKIDDNIVNDVDSYKFIHRHLKTILPELVETNLFQTDLYKTSITQNLDNALQSQLKNTIQFLNKISPKTPNKNIEEFKKRFTERYEDYEMPLLLTLDTETGIGYPAKDTNGVNELIEDIYATGNIHDESDIKWTTLQAQLLRLITESNKHNKKIIEISENDFKGIDFSEGNLPTTFSVMFKVLNASTNKIDMSGIGGSSAINLLGRFAGGNDELNDLVKQLAQFEQEQMPDKILAEIVHLPESRTGNILARPNFRDYEIPYLAKSNLDNDFQIKMEDLCLKVNNERLILFDKRLQKEIIPRLSNAHNYSYNSLPVYHFLCDLQTQYFNKPFIGFNWGVLSKQFDFLPRVEFQNTILSTAKWQLHKQDIQPLQDKKKTNSEKHTLFFELKKKIELPDKFLIADGDNELLIDCNNPIAIDTFIDAVKHRNEITLEEYLFEDDYALIKDTNGNSYTNECIALVLNENSVKEKTSLTKPNTFKSKLIFSIGSEWLYYKIYCGSKTADYILTEKIKHITETLLEKNIIDKWFFIRYADPDVHLRFRLHVSDFEKYGEVLQLVNEELEPLLNQHVISKIQTDTYKRELERYGDNSMDLSETLFFNDSVFVTDMLDMLDSDSGGTIRWQVALRSVDELLNDFKLSLTEKYTFIDSLNTSFFKEHGGSKELKLTLDNKFRTLRSQIETLMDVGKDKEKEYYPIIELLKFRSKANDSIVKEILLLNETGQLQLSLYNLLSSILHMNLDRLFMGRNRTNEFVVYDLLARYYKSNLARLQSTSKKETELTS